jgi:hypothetical protein
MDGVGESGSNQPGGAGRARRKVLVISTVARSAEALRKAIGGDVGELRVVVPVVHQSRLQWLANADDEPREQAEQEAAQIGRELPSEQIESTAAGDSDPFVAVKDALRDFEADEVVVVTRPNEQASWLEEGKAVEIAEELHGVKVTKIELGE